MIKVSYNPSYDPNRIYIHHHNIYVLGENNSWFSITVRTIYIYICKKNYYIYCFICKR